MLATDIFVSSQHSLLCFTFCFLANIAHTSLWCNFYLRLLERDPFHLKCTLVHLAAAMELGHSNDLYLLACNLVKDYPQK
jgi:hypothetical protein